MNYSDLLNMVSDSNKEIAPNYELILRDLGIMKSAMPQKIGEYIADFTTHRVIEKYTGYDVYNGIFVHSYNKSPFAISYRNNYEKVYWLNSTERKRVLTYFLSIREKPKYVSSLTDEIDKMVASLLG